jgi:hypothetical protein
MNLVCYVLLLIQQYTTLSEVVRVARYLHCNIYQYSAVLIQYILVR